MPLIVCFGDSLTAGYQVVDGVVQETPYGGFLQERLGSAGEVLVRGVCGELTGEMVMRFRRDVIDAGPAWVLLLGGTNDLGCQAAPAEIMRNLIAMYERARAAGVNVAAMTVPAIRMDARSTDERAWLQDHLDRRIALNDGIRRYCREHEAACLDLYAATTDEHGLLARPYSNDGLHLTTAGYRLMADLAYDRLFAGGPRGS